MLRGLIFLLKLVIVVGVAFLLADNPGQVSLEWGDWRIDTSVAMMLVALLVVVVVAAQIYRSWRSLRRAPRDIGRSLDSSRRQRGYRALTRGLAAVAAGDAKDASHWAVKADRLLDEPPLTRLLSAQAAQLSGDGAAAKRHFNELLKSEDTRFLGLRGLLNEARRDGDEAAARSYLKQAQALRPNTPWVVDNLFELSEKAGDLATAEGALKQAQRHKLMAPAEANRKRAIILLERAAEAETRQDLEPALHNARNALKLVPSLLPAILMVARLQGELGRPRKAARTIEQAWPGSPHPELATLYLELYPQESTLDRLRRFERMTGTSPEAAEARIALARAALDATIWGEARRLLAPLAEDQPERRVCHLMAELEEREKQDATAAAQWWRRAEQAPPDPAWVCAACGAAAESWSPHCGACQAFDSLAWGHPPTVSVLIPADDGGSAETAEDGPGERAAGAAT
jgi:HemY protein